MKPTYSTWTVLNAQRYKLCINVQEWVDFGVSQRNLHAKMAMPDSQRYPWNLYLINYVEDIVVLRGLEVFNF